MSTKGMLTAERNGYDAYILDDHQCPYKDKRKDNGKLTWSRAYRNAWIMGYQKAALYFRGDPSGYKL